MKSKLSERVQKLPPSKFAEIRRLVMGCTDVIRLELGEPDFATPKHVKEAAIQAINEDFTHYTPTEGLLELREAVARKLKRENGIEADPETEILITDGGFGAVFAAVQSLVNPGDEVLVPDPAWPRYFQNVLLAGGVPKRIFLEEKDGFVLDVDEVKKHVTKKTKLVVLNTPNNPTGAVVSKNVLEEIGDLAVEHDLILLLDEVYERIVYEPKHFSLATHSDIKDRIITVFSLSKTYAMTGWRIGYAVSNENVIKAMGKVSTYANACRNSVAQKAAIAALDGPQECVENMVKEYRRRRDLMIDRLKEMESFSVTKPTGAFYVYPRILLDVESPDFVKQLLEKAKVSVMPGTTFSVKGEKYLRFSYANSMEKISEAMDRVQGLVSQLMKA
ncbi:MAG: pyridoxal phosphate-dependent aminotransferase [Candidatus Bathyarchaeia archaeon]